MNLLSVPFFLLAAISKKTTQGYLAKQKGSHIG